MPLLAEFVKEETITTGTGTITLTPVTGFAEFSESFTDGSEVYYVIKNDNNLETGVGTITGKTLSRDTIHSTLISGTLNNTNPTTLNLIGSSEVICSITATAYAEANATLKNKVIDDATNKVHANAIHKEVRNESGVELVVGTAVSFSDYNLATGSIEVIKADNTTTTPSIGLVSEANIAVGELGVITSTGIITGVNTDGLPENNIAYVNGSGALTITKPTSGWIQPIAFIIKEHLTEGILQVLAAHPLQDSTDIRHTPSNNISSTTVQTAIEELDTEKEPANSNIQTHISTTSGNPHSVTKTDVGLGNVPNIDTTNATLQGNTFNGASQLVQLDGTGALPAVNGSNLTDITADASNLSVVHTGPTAPTTGNFKAGDIYVPGVTGTELPVTYIAVNT